MRLHDINSVLSAQLGKTSAKRMFAYSKFFGHRLEALQGYLAEALDQPDFTVIDANDRPRANPLIKRLLVFAFAFGDADTAGQWARAVGSVIPAFSSTADTRTANGAVLGARMREMKAEGVTPEYARLILSAGHLARSIQEAWRDGVPSDYLEHILEALEYTEDAVTLGRSAWRDGLPLEYAVAVA